MTADDPAPEAGKTMGKPAADTAEKPADKPAPKGPRPMRGLFRNNGRRSIVYVLGTTRSGTSALRGALFQTRFKGYGEGHMDPLLTRLSEAVSAHADAADPALGNAWSKLNEEALKKALFKGYEAYLSAEVKSDFLLDKTPTRGAIRAAPALNRLHTDPYFIFCARRHVDNVQSKRKKFPGMSFAACCREWAFCNADWQEARGALDGNFLEFDFAELVTKPEEIVGRIADYLGMNRPRERENMRVFLSARRPQGSTDRDLTRFLKLSETGWSDAEKAQFKEICGPVGDAMGYGYESYFRADQTGGDTGPDHPDDA